MAKSLRIAQVVSGRENVPPTTGKGGLEFVVSWLTEELVKRGHQVTLFAPGQSQTKAKLVSLLPQSLSNHSPRPEEETFFSIKNTILAATLANDFDLIHCHNGNGDYITPFVRLPVVETLHGPYQSEFADFYLKNEAYRQTLAPLLAFSQKINYVAVSRDQEAKFKPLEPFYFQKHTCIHNGIPVTDFTFSPKSGDYLLFIGYLNKNKGVDTAVRIARQLGLKLILAGHNAGEEQFFAEHIAPYLNDRISYVGPVDLKTKNELYQNALVTLAPITWDEPFGLTLIESQACGTPVLAFNRGAAKEVINHGQTGFVVETEDEMISVIKKVNALKRSDCRHWVEANFSVEKMTDNYEALYQKLLG